VSLRHCLDLEPVKLMKPALRGVRNAILETLSPLPLIQREKGDIIGVSQQMVSYHLKKSWWCNR